jgi:hypothetical protein
VDVGDTLGINDDGSPSLASGAFDQFFDGPVPARTDCIVMTAGPCTYQVCPGLAPSQPQPNQVDPGEITIAGPIHSNTLRNNARVGQIIFDGLAIFHGGDVLSISSRGNVVPPFSSTIVAPSRPVLTQPAADPSEFTVAGDVLFDRTQPFTLQWTGGDVGTLGFTLVNTIDNFIDPQEGGPTINEQLQCAFPAADQQGVIPAEALAFMHPGTPTTVDCGPNCSFISGPGFELVVDNIVVVTDGAWAVKVDANQFVSHGNATIR